MNHIHKQKHICLLFLLFVLFGGRGIAGVNPESYNFSYLTADDGLAQNTVDYIYKDSRGYMWFATWNGLNRFDGHEFVRYGIRDGRNSLNSLFVRTLVEDDRGHLWVGTEEGVNLIELASGEVRNFDHSRQASNPIFSSAINTFLKDKRGRIWIGFNRGLAIASLNERGDLDEIEVIQEGEEVNVNALCMDDDGTIWVGYADGSLSMVKSLSEKSYSSTPLSPGGMVAHSVGEILSLCPDGDDLWVGCGIGLVRYNRKSGASRLFLNDPADDRSLIQNYIKDMAIDLDGDLIVATYKGLSIYNKESDDFLQIAGDPARADRLNNHFVNSLYADSSGILWIGTEKGGINKMIKKEVMFELYRHNSKQPASLSPNPVNAIFEDSRGALWIGTVEGGLNKRNADGQTFTHFRNRAGDANSLSHDAVCFITEGSGYLWVATWGGGINRMKLNGEGHFEHQGAFVKAGAFASDFVSWMVYDEQSDGLWVAGTKGLDFFDLRDSSVKHVMNTSANEEQDGEITSVSGIYLDSSRRLWVGTELDLHCINLVRSDVRLGRIVSERCRVMSSDRRLPRHEKVNCIIEVADHTIWIGTYGNGLFRLEGRDDNRYCFKNYGTESGLSDNVVYAIEEDRQGNLWLSTDRGLSSFCPETERATTYYVTDGLPSNQFYWVASEQTGDGKLLFDNIEGAVMFDPVVRQSDTTQLKVRLIGGHLYNEKINPRILSGEWNLREQDKSISIAFSFLYYIAPEKIRYAYKLDGFDAGWTEVDPNRRFASYTNLPAGKYRFEVKCTNPDGEWSNQITTLSIRVTPPFYKEKWFLVSGLVIFILLIYYFNEMRITNLRRQKELLEKKVEEYTRKIEVQKDEILVQKKELEESDRQLQQATQDKINFFTNITHEFRTPLTLILGPIEQALSLSQNPKVIEQLTLVRKNSKYLLSLINQLMDFRKADAGSMEVNKAPGNFAEFLQSILLPFKALAEPRRIKIEECYRIPSPCFSFDNDLMQKILVNLLSNAVKFTPDNGSIRLSAALLSAKAADRRSTNKYLYIAVSDTGTGIPDDAKALIFDRFYQTGDRNIYPVYGQTGTGIGLYLCKQIVELLGGMISVKDSPSGGASFRILFPLDASDFEVDDNPAYYTSPDVCDSETATEEEGQENPAGQDKPLLLIAEDNPDMRTFIKSILAEKFAIIEASNGDSALKKTLKYLPDFIISDIMMPVMDGLEFCRKVKNNFSTSHIPVLLLTAKTSTDVRIEGYRVGADGYIAKPFDAGLLVARINNMLESRNRLHKAFDSSLDVKSLDIQEESQDRKFLDRLMEVIKENYQDATFDVAELIEKMSMSKSLLHKKLQLLVGQSAVKAIRSYRLTKAKELMESGRNSQVTVSEIAYEVGFNDPKYFTRCFTKHYGMSPSEFLSSL
ncbi:MAG: response regulator [Parabacteroides sp.]|nr:response regulator [Parabacteroides sp.]